MVRNREQRGPPWGVAEQPRPDAEQRGRSPTILLLGGADQPTSVATQRHFPCGSDQMGVEWLSERPSRSLTGEIPIQPFRLERQLSARQTAIRR